MTNFYELMKDSLVDTNLEAEVAEVVAELTGKPDEVAQNTVSVGFLKVGVKPNAPRQVFIEFLADKLRPGRGSFTDLTLDDLAAGQSYINLGGWVGDQRDALVLLGIGVHHGAWQILTPATLGIPDDSDEGKQMMGMGFVYNSGLDPQVKADIQAEQDSVDKQNGVTK